jgi:hypothetical protein
MAVAAFVVGVVALLVAGWSAWSAHRSVKSAAASAVEARRARLDAFGLAVTLVGVQPRSERWIQPPFLDQLPAVTPPGTEYVVPRQDNDLLLLGAEVLLVNEGATSYTTAES